MGHSYSEKRVLRFNQMCPHLLIYPSVHNTGNTHQRPARSFFFGFSYSCYLKHFKDKDRGGGKSPITMASSSHCCCCCCFCCLFCYCFSLFPFCFTGNFSCCCFCCSFAFSLWCTGTCGLIHSFCCYSGCFWSCFWSFDGISCWGDRVSVADIFPLDATYFPTPLGVLPVSATTFAFAIAVAVAFFQGQAFSICSKTTDNQK